VKNELQTAFGEHAPEELPPLPVDAEMARKLEAEGYVFTLVPPGDTLLHSKTLKKARVALPDEGTNQGEGLYSQAIEQNHMQPLPTQPYWIAYQTFEGKEPWKMITTFPD
jgi:hypothetical protein